MNQIQTIKQEIERRIEQVEDFKDNPVADELRNILSFIESLEKEQPKRKLRKVCNLREDLKADKPIEERLEELRQIRAEKDRLDEAAEESAKKEGFLAGPVHNAAARTFKAGAKWMAEQGWHEEAVIKGSEDVVWLTYNVELPIDLAKYFKDGDKVIVQIRKV